MPPALCPLPYTHFGKRLSDILLSAAAICALSPLFWGFVIAVVLDSRGGAFFYQWRVGRSFKPFRLIKLRSMKPVSHAAGAGFEPGDARRVTRVGRFMRKTKIDELPGLFNVLFGHMSLVGPRPEVPRYVEAFRDDYRDILSVRPGLSDLASIKYRDEEEILARQPDPETYYRCVILPDKIQLAMQYVREMSTATDLRIVAETLRAVLGRGQRAEGRGQRAESIGQRAEGREQRAEGREQRAESREHRAESRGQRAESRGQGAESREEGSEEVW